LQKKTSEAVIGVPNLWVGGFSGRESLQLYQWLRQSFLLRLAMKITGH